MTPCCSCLFADGKAREASNLNANNALQQPFPLPTHNLFSTAGRLQRFQDGRCHIRKRLVSLSCLSNNPFFFSFFFFLVLLFCLILSRIRTHPAGAFSALVAFLFLSFSVSRSGCVFVFLDYLYFWFFWAGGMLPVCVCVFYLIV